jgi:acyl carrier protein
MDGDMDDETLFIERLLTHDLVAAADAVELPVDGVPRVIALAEVREYISEPTLREQLWQELGDGAPAGVLVFDRIPRVGAELDREAVVAEARSRGAGLLHVPPTDDVERRLAAIWSGAIDLPRVSVCDDFLDVGGDSLTAMQIMMDVETEFALSLDVQDLLSAGTVRRLASLVRGRRQPVPSP